MKAKINLAMKSLALLGICTLFAACDSGSDFDNFETKTVELEEGVEIQLRLDDRATDSVRRFASIEEYELYESDQIQKGYVNVDAKLYSELSHGLDPFQISVLSIDGTVMIDEFEYKATEEGLFMREIGSLADFKIDEYYGKSGDYVDQEIAFALDHSNDTELLLSTNFRNPIVQVLVSDMLGSVGKNKLDKNLIQSSDTRTWHESSYRNYLSPGGGLPSGYYYLSLWGWNRSHGSWSRKATGMSQARYCYSGNLSICFSPPKSDQSAPHSVKTMVSVEVNGGKGWKGPDLGHMDVTKTTSRKRNRGAESKHSIQGFPLLSNKYLN